MAATIAAAEDVAFLANSENRVAVLRSLLDGPHSRHVVAEETGVSRVTLGRILDDLEERRWITQRGQLCDATPLGAWVEAEFTAFCEAMASARRLGAVYRWFPEEDFGFPVCCLADADITLVSRADASAPISRLVRQVEAGGRVRAFSFAITSQFLEACWRHVTDGAATMEWVFTPAVLEVLRDSPEMADWSREMLESGRAEFRTYDGDIPYVVIETGAAVNLRLADDDGAATALLQSDHDRVRSWATSTFEAYWHEGTPVTVDAFAP